MQATEFEFKRRFWIIAAFYGVGFYLSTFDHVRVFAAVQYFLAPTNAVGLARATTVRQVVIAGGALLVFLAAVIRTWGAAYLRTNIVHDSGQHAEALVADGPFRYVRNPLYLASLPMAAGIGVLMSWLGWLFVVVANWIFVYRLIFREEAALRESQGESYREYFREVPRFWPSLTPRVPSGGRPAQWGQAFVGETFVWLFALAELCLAVTLNTELMAIVFIIGFVAHFIVMGRVRQHAKNAS